MAFNPGKKYDFINVEIGTADHMTDHDLMMAVKFTENFAIMPLIAMTVSIGGYDHDRREIWEIPEAREYMLRFATAMLARNIPLERFLPETVNIFRCCRAASTGIKVAIAEEDYDLVEEVRNHIGQVKRHMM
jgi:hypothetical protein